MLGVCFAICIEVYLIIQITDAARRNILTYAHI